MGYAVLRCFLVFVFFLQLTACGEEEPSVVLDASLQTVTLDVQKMDCPMCKITIRKALEKVDGVRDAEVDYDAKTASVTFDPGSTSISALIQATTDAGYPSGLKAESKS